MTSSIYRFRLGEVECVAIRDGGLVSSAGFLFPHVPEEELHPILQEQGLVADLLPSSWTCLLIDTGKHTLLVDTGYGSEVATGGRLLTHLEEAGYLPEDIDGVFLSHAHPDHIGGCIDADGNVIFKEARHVMGKKEHDFWSSQENLSTVWDVMARYARRVLPAIRDRLVLVNGADEVLPGIRVVEAFGHTLGHLGLEIQSQGEVLLYLADTALHPLHLQHPSWYTSVDMDPERMIATRRRLLGKAAETGTRVLFFHFDFPSIGRVLQDGNNWRWQPLDERM